MRAIRCMPGYWFDFAKFTRNKGATLSQLSYGTPWPCFDAPGAGGVAKGHYFHQDLLVAQRIFDRKPTQHVDVGSRVDGFVAHVASFRAIEVLDIRPNLSQVSNVTFRRVDVMSLPANLENYTESLSCLHALEHFGLGRYGDPIDPLGHEKGLDSLYRLLKPRGVLYLSLPIGPSRVEFNAHRVFSIPHVMRMLRGRFSVESFAYVDDGGDLHRQQDVNCAAAAHNFHCRFGCGIFELVRS